MYFRCRNDVRCEDVQAEGNRTYEFHPAKPHVRRSGVEHLFNPDFIRNIDQGNVFAEYAQLVRDYSRRCLSYETDIINAFRGIMLAIKPFLRTEGYFCALPFSLFDRALLWYPTSPAGRREPMGDERIMMPTWSWSGWVGSVDYELDILHLGDTRLMYTVNEWYRYNFENDSLVPILYHESLNPPFAQGLLYSYLPALRENPTCIISWVTQFKMTLSQEESHTTHYVTDTLQSIPFFTIFDTDGDPCGYLPSTNRDWARSYKERGGICDMILISHAHQSSGDEFAARMNTLHKKYRVLDNSFVCFYNVMLVEFHAGIAYRVGVGRIHKDAVHVDEHLWEERRIVILG